MRKKTMENFSQRIFQFGKLGRKLGGINRFIFALINPISAKNLPRFNLNFVCITFFVSVFADRFIQTLNNRIAQRRLQWRCVKRGRERKVYTLQFFHVYWTSAGDRCNKPTVHSLQFRLLDFFLFLYYYFFFYKPLRGLGFNGSVKSEISRNEIRFPGASRSACKRRKNGRPVWRSLSTSKVLVLKPWNG